MNLLTNASQAIKDRGEITISTNVVKESIEIRISDTGCGIADEHLEQLFNPFFTTKEVGKGTGLGLSISYGIIKKHGGNIYAESELSKGSTFIINLPIVKEIA